MKIATKTAIKLVRNSLIFCLLVISGCVSTRPQKPEALSENKAGRENDMYDGPDKAAQFEFERTKDPATGKVPREKYMTALQKTVEIKTSAGFGPGSTESFGAGWAERGPVSDVVGPSSGNTRANGGVASGRIRAIWVDNADATGKTVWIGGVDGGLWKTTDITLSPATWTPVNDFFNNLAISDITQQPGNPSVMYFSTGEGYFNGDAVRGNGVFKSTDHGVTWAQLANTSGFTCTRIICDAAGRIYLGTGPNTFEANGLLRSIDGGTTWINITPAGSNVRIADLELSSTGRLHVTTGLGNTSTGMYRFTDNPSTTTTATSAGNWVAATTAFPYPSGANCRVELGCNGNVLYALPSNTSAQVATIYKSIDGGVTWAATGGQPTAGWASKQAWYALAVDIDPSDPTNSCIVGGLDTWKTTNGGTSWTKISSWVGTSGQYVHADNHKVLWYDNGNKLLFGCDGGLHFSSDKGVTIRDRNVGLRIKQFYSCAIHPNTTNYFLAGAQDNGGHQFSNPGLSSTVEVTGGDGCGVVIDQLTPANQFSNYVFNVFNRSTNSGAAWSGVGFYKGTNLAASYFGSFINPLDYDNTNKIIYAGGDGGEFFRWTTATTTPAGDYFVGGTPAFPAGASIVSSITNFAGAQVSAVTVAPTTANRVYFGTNGGKVVYIDGANVVASGAAGINISTGLPGGTVSCINFGTTESNMITSFSNYGVASVWVSSDGGTNWTSLDNNGVNLPDMPVRWCMFYPGDNTKAILGTETGVWETTLINGTTTVWTANTTFPTVRTDMLKYRSADGTLIAATHGRGLWSTHLPIATDYFRTVTSGNWNSPATWESSPVSDFSSGLVSPSSLTPDANANSINIRSGHTVTVTANVTTDQTFVNPGGTLVVTGSTLTVSSNGLTIQSDASGTGRIGNSTGTISGNVNVERYIANAGHRAWHLLSGKSVSGTQTIFNSWQEGGVNTAGSGTWITSTNFPNGFDATNNNLSSIATYNQAGPNWVYTMPNTNVTTLSSNQGYMLFVRGDRSYTATLPTPIATSATTLHTTGALNQGTQPAVTVSSTGIGYTMVGNPFMSPIDFELFSGTANLNQSYYIWDAALAGNHNVGGFRLVTRTGVNTYTATPTTGSDNTLRYINSGQAFMLKTTGANASVAFTEAHKAALTAIVPPTPNGINDQQITANLYIVGTGNDESLVDGIRIRYNAAYKMDASDDADKISNFGENIYLMRDNRKLILEDRPMISAGETVILFTANTGIKKYRLKIEGFDFVQTDIPARLEDKFLGTSTKLDLRGNNDYDYSITADPASAAPDRFSIVFGDKKADVTIGGKGINIYPNPVTGQSIGMQFNDAAAGVYQLRLISSMGQVVFTRSITHGGTSTFYTIDMGKQVSAGSYRMEIIRPDHSKLIKALVIDAAK